MSASATVNATSSLGLVVVAAGSSRRFGSDKLSVRLGGRTILPRAVGCLRAVFPQAPLVVVVRGEELEGRAEELRDLGVTAFVPGGEHRQDSVRAGVEALHLSGEALVLIHDGARPFVPADDIRRVVAAAEEAGAAVLAAPVADTVKEVDPQGRVLGTLPRERLV
ncbi:MAG: 2-C-methyl-D-erythritol 4-phosphate cytidylyltransferase, partial [Thermoanaerobaculum sp.]